MHKHGVGHARRRIVEFLPDVGRQEQLPIALRQITRGQGTARAFAGSDGKESVSRARGGRLAQRVARVFDRPVHQSVRCGRQEAGKVLVASVGSARRKSAAVELFAKVVPVPAVIAHEILEFGLNAQHSSGLNLTWGCSASQRGEKNLPVVRNDALNDEG